MTEAAELLRLWERGQGQGPARRALTLLRSALPERSPADLGELAPGRCDAELIRLRERLFGREVAAVAACPGCGGRIEAEFDLAGFAQPEAPATDGPLSVVADGRELRFRLPTCADLVAVSGAPDMESAGEMLLERCLAPGAPGRGLSARAAELVAARMAEADPQAGVELALECPGCGHRWTAAFDVAGFLWAEVAAAARALLRDVHTLASAYGWREADVLGLTAARRRLYVEMAAG